MVNAVTIDRGRVRLCARLLLAGQDLVVVVTGGDAPHVGAVSCAGEGDTQSFSFAGHRERELCAPLAEELSRELGRRVVVIAGMHWNEFDRELLAQVYEAWREMSAVLKARL